MSRLVQFKRGTTAQNEVYGGLTGELTVDIDKQTLVLHDGAGGFSPMATEDNAQTLENKTISLASNSFPGLDGDGLEIVSNELNLDDTVIRTTGAQTIEGVKSFSTAPVVTTSDGIQTDQLSFSLINATAETINFAGDGTNIQIGAATGTTTINHNLSIAGDFNVAGTFTTTEEQSLVIEDKNVILADTTTPNDVYANGGGVILKGTTDKTILWLSGTNAWESSEDFNLATGKSYYVNGTEVLSEDTLGANVVSSSLTSLGTITTGTWEADPIAPEYGGTGQTTYTDGEILIGNSTGNTLSKSTLTDGTGISITNGAGDITITNTDRGSSQFIFKNIADDQGIPQIIASSNSDTLNVVSAGSAYVNFDGQSQTLTIGAEGENYTAGDGLDLSTQNEFSVDDSVVRTSGAQTIEGVKTFNSTISGSIDGNAATASKLDPGAFINGVFFDGTENINLPAVTLENDLIAGEGISSSGPYNGSTERTFINSDKGSDQVIFKNVQNASGVTQFSAGANTDVLQFDAAGDLSIEFDSENNRITYSLTVPEAEAYIAGDGLDLTGQEFSVDDTVVRTSGDQTIDGVKTVVQPLELSSQASALTQAVRADRSISAGDGLSGGGTLDGNLSFSVDESVVRTTGNQSVAGTKTFVNTIVATSPSPGIIVNEIESTSTQFDLANSNVSTINLGGAATEINIGSANGQTNFSHDINVATGGVYQIGNNDVLTSDSLGTNVINSSLQALGTVSVGTWEASTIDTQHGGTGETSYTNGQILIGDSSTGGLNKTTLTAGDNVSIDNGNGTITINGRAYTAGDGITLSSGEFSVNAGDGLVQQPSGLAIDGSVIRTTGTQAINGGLALTSLGVGTAVPSTSGDIRATGSITAYYLSDQRLKKNVSNLENSLDSIQKIRGVEFDWTDEEINRQGGEDDYFVRRHSVGVIAQEIEEVLPEAVGERDDGYKAVKYELLVPLLIEGMKDQQKQIQMLEEKVENLCRRL